MADTSSARATRLACACLLALACATSQETAMAAEPTTLTVATDGRDDHPGTADRPFASLARARAEIRQLKKAGRMPEGGVIVTVRGGTYHLAETFELSEGDGGTEGGPVVYRAQPGEVVRLTGGKVVRDLGPVTDRAVLPRLAPAARTHVLQADLKAQGIKDFGQMKARGFSRPHHPAGLELFFQDKPMPLARYPNRGWLTVAAVPAGPSGGRFVCADGRPTRWAASDDLWVHGYWKQDWADSYERVKSIDTKKKEIATHPPHGCYGYHRGKRFYFLNVLEELDQPGEWHLDRAAGILYFWPPASEGAAVVSLTGTLVSMRDVSHVTLQGFILECCRATAVVIRGGNRCRIASCVLRNIGNRAVSISGGTHSGVAGCDITETGDGGISLNGGDRKTLTPAHLYAVNNHIWRYSRTCRTYRAAVQVGGVGNRVAHNHIHDAPHMGVGFGGNDHVLEFNHVHDICRETGDVGAFYTGRDWTCRGHVVRHNFFHHIRGPYTHGAMSVYLDDCFCGVTIYGNVFYKASRAAFIGGGRDNRVENNVFVDCHPSVHVDARGVGWAKRHIAPGGGWRMRQKLKSVPYDKPPYTKYPNLASILDDEPHYPKHNVVARNLSVGGRWADIAAQAKSRTTIKDNWVTADDPGFLDPKALNFQLRDDSPAYQKIPGFKKIPFERIGLQADELRAALPPRPSTFYVATDGSDRNPGTRDKPFATLEAARDAVRKLKSRGGATVIIRGGVYQREKPLELNKQDSGRDGQPVTYRAAPGESVQLLGGKVVTGWKPVTDEAILARLDPKARGRVLQADLKAQGITDLGGVNSNRLALYFQGRPMTLARWPNDGFVKIAGLVEPNTVNVRGTRGSETGKFLYQGDRPTRWKDENDLWVHGYWFWDWSDQRHPVASIDTTKRVIAVKPPYHGYGYRVGQWFYALNVLAELDQPGEWYLDRHSALLYFWPPAPIDRGQAVVSLLDTMVSIEGASDLVLRGLTVEAARGHGAVIKGGERIRVAACTFRNLGGYAVRVQGGRRCAVVGCDIYQMGQGGVTLSGGDRRTLTPCGHVAENNHIHHYGLWDRMYQKAISLSGVGCRAAHNLVHDAPHIAIGFGGNDHLIELNEIHSVCFESNDAGAMYAGRDWTMRGTVVRHNYLHHISGFRGRGCVGVYLDDMFSGTQIVGNLFHKVTRAAFIGGGRDCLVANNIFVDCRPALHIDNRAQGWAKGSVTGVMKQRLDAMPYKSKLWRSRYPKLVDVWDDDPAAPKGNVVARNVSTGGRWDGVHPGARKYVTFQDNLIDEAPHFVARAKANFQLRDDSPAYALGFERIPIERIGLYRDELRASWPVTHTVRGMPEPPRPTPKGPPPVFKVTKATAPVRIDGDLTEKEWLGARPATAMLVQQGIRGEKTQPRTLAWLLTDGAHLLVGVNNAVDPARPLHKGQTWGQDDAVELAVRNPALGKKAPILVLRGYTNGHFESSDEAGAPKPVVDAAAKGVSYAAKVHDARRWTCEWRVPLASLGIDPAKHKKLQFNLSVRKTASDLWQMWEGTRGYSWAVGAAGVLELP